MNATTNDQPSANQNSPSENSSANLKPSIEKNEAPPVNGNRSKMLKLFTAVLLALAILLFCLWFFYFRFYESTDDAYANGNKISLNSAVSGSVIAYFADDTGLVTEGQLLALLDPTQYQIEYTKQLAKLKATILQVKQIYDNVLVQSYNRDSKRVKLEKARYDYHNRAQLVGSLAISNEDYTHAKDDLTIAEQEFEMAESSLKVATDAAGNTLLEDHPLIEQQKEAVRSAFYKLKHCSIYAPATGYVAERAVEVGQWVQPSTPLLSIIPSDYVWVDANFKETQLTKMRVGQPASITFDIYGSSVKFEGKVLGIASGTGSVFSLIPPQNATGNWIKIVQRLPVRISLDKDKVKQYPVRLGISAYVDVDIADQNLPMLVQTPTTKPIATTKVFDLNFDEVNAAIEEIMAET